MLLWVKCLEERALNAPGHRSHLGVWIVWHACDQCIPMPLAHVWRESYYRSHEWLDNNRGDACLDTVLPFLCWLEHLFGTGSTPSEISMFNININHFNEKKSWSTTLRSPNMYSAMDLHGWRINVATQRRQRRTTALWTQLLALGGWSGASPSGDWTGALHSLLWHLVLGDLGDVWALFCS